ncbi:zinc finger protein 12-like [Uranotaenia lowii]|uniref:zinc finger protein 12-like n=1 Tax=Uranotaenia lowii TaxID=190385 RepID=UPI00247ABD6B|nr:zinc finger protein 12-like [Uranotaenia lowii]
MENGTEKCFICVEETSLFFRNLLQITTKYSGTTIYKVVERFLESDLTQNEASLMTAVICHECMVKLNDYDAAYTKAVIIQQEFTDLLRKSLAMAGNDRVVLDSASLKEEEEEEEQRSESSSADYLVELEQIPEEEDEDEAYSESAKDEDTVTDTMTDNDTKSVGKFVSMKCNTCGMSFSSIDEMKEHSHRKTSTSSDDLHLAVLEYEEVEDKEAGETREDFVVDDIEYIDEERLEDDEAEIHENFPQIQKDDVEDINALQDKSEVVNKIPKKRIFYRIVKCLECNVQFSSKVQLKRHQNEHHLKEADLADSALHVSHTCDICGLTVKTKSALASHVAKHNRTSNFDCTFCGKKFNHKGALTRHVPMHTGEKPYQCDTCGKQFIHYSSFHMHKLTHGNIREKKCEVCGYMLRSSSHLKRHMRVHSGEKPFACPTCGQKFAQRYNMMTHLKAHQGIYREYAKEYKCPLCDEKYQRKLALQEHLTRTHNTVLDSAFLKPAVKPPNKKPEVKIEMVEFVSPGLESDGENFG